MANEPIDPASCDGCRESYRDPERFKVDVPGLSLEFLPSGEHRLEALLELIASAQKTLKLFYYMFQNDEAGQQVRHALVTAAQRGVEIQLIVDRFGTDAKAGFFKPIEDAGGQFYFFNPRWGIRYLIRNHQKFAIRDEQEVLTGGANVSDHYFAPPQDNGWCDLGVRLQGEIVDQLVDWFAHLLGWSRQGAPHYSEIRRILRQRGLEESNVQMLVGGPTSVPSNWARRVKRDLAKASRLDLVMAYFSPPRSFRRQIRRIAARGAVRIMTAGRSDNSTTIGASRALYGGLLKSGCKVLEFEACKLHAKLIVIDDIVYFGSANFDHRSIRLNLELMFRIRNAELAARLREHVDWMESGAREITREWHHKRATLLARMGWWIGWFMVSVVDYTVSRRLNLPLRRSTAE